jgi:copper(I)-binding protein
MRRTLLALAIAATAAPLVAAAQDRQPAAIVASQAWTRAVGASSPTAAGYMTLHNRGGVADRLVGAETPLARSVELHEQRMEDSIMRMRPQPEGIPIPPGGTVILGPGGLHLMLVGPTRALARGERVPLTLRFERAGEVRVELAVEAAGARQPSHAGH